MLRQKNGLPTSVAGAAGTKREEKSKSIKSANETAAVQASSTATPDKAVAIKKSKAGSVLPQKKKKAEEPEQVNDVKIEPAPTVKSKKEVEILPMTPPSSSSPPKKERTKVNLARRASLRIKGTGS